MESFVSYLSSLFLLCLLVSFYFFDLTFRDRIWSKNLSRNCWPIKEAQKLFVSLWFLARCRLLTRTNEVRGGRTFFIKRSSRPQVALAPAPEIRRCDGWMALSSHSAEFSAFCAARSRITWPSSAPAREHPRSLSQPLSETKTVFMSCWRNTPRSPLWPFYHSRLQLIVFLITKLILRSKKQFITFW